MTYVFVLSSSDVQGVLPTLIALAGKAACTFAFVGLIIYTSEMYPTEIRYGSNDHILNNKLHAQFNHLSIWTVQFVIYIVIVM